MLETIGAMEALPEGDINGAEMANAARLCRSCDNTEACSRWLEEHRDGAATPLETCPNADLFLRWANS